MPVTSSIWFSDYTPSQIPTAHAVQASPHNTELPLLLHKSKSSGHMATICQSRAKMDYSYSRSSNTASNPLPSVPRRSASSSRAQGSIFPRRPQIPTASTSWTNVAKFVVQPPTPPTPETTQQSAAKPTSENAESRTPRAHGVQNTPEPPAPGPSTKAAALVLPPKAASLRINIASVISPQLSDTTEITLPPSVEARLIRKKSGQPVKSSLKASSRGDLHMATFAMSASSSKSEPVTPTSSKFVHFDSQDHVKLFLAEQKPLAVSRDGSPTDDTSGTESDFPSFIYSRGSFEPARIVLSMRLTNMPCAPPSWTDCALESLTLAEDGKSIVGNARVRNLAFEKWLAVRFTFDSWQTTSEVTAKYAETILDGVFPGSEDGAFDRFTFTLRLNDLLASIEHKTLLLALRYTVAGREIWDNNDGRNYQAAFTKTKVALKPLPSPEPVSSPRQEEKRMLNLKSRLEQVAKGRDGRSSPSFLSPAVSSPKSEIPKQNSFASRYDFGASMRNNTWQPPRHQRTSTHPSAVPFPGSSASKVMGSPRDLGDEYRPTAVETGPDSLPFPIAPRNHQRGYFDLAIPSSSGSLRKTPPGTPLSHRFLSFPPVDGKRMSPLSGKEQLGLPSSWGHVRESGGSNDSTPSILSPSGSTESSSAPSPTDPLLILRLTEGTAAGSPVGGDYSQFINQFCFYTGGSGASNADSIPRARSASNVQELLAQNSPPSRGYSHDLPVRSPSLDDVRIRSGSTTPTLSSPFRMSTSQATTPVAAT